ncbi:MAG: GNAT family N-acetyltransferase [Anaerolineae bacterium]
MISIEHLRRCEVDWYAAITNVDVHPWGRIHHNTANPLSYDSNHAVILDPACDVDAVLDEIVQAYESKRLTPRIYSSLQSGVGARLRPYLEAHGFTYEPSETRCFLRLGACRVEPRAALEIQRFRTITPGLLALVNSERQEPWTIGTLLRHLPKADLHLLVGLVDGEPVTMASINLMDGASRVDDVITHVAHRGKGYCRALIHALLAYYDALSTQPLYLWAENPTAIRIYQEAGFVEQPLDADSWYAWKDPSKR